MVKKVFKVVSVLGIFILIIVCSYFTSYYYKILSTSFRLSPKYVSSALYKNTSVCKELKDCDLIEGDILIRRYITNRTWFFDKIADPFFTHSAMYLGDYRIIEAVGKEKLNQDEIVINDITKSDWYDTGIESWVIVRVKNIPSKITKIKKDLEEIAVDPGYSFGLSTKNHKQLSCSDLILNPLINNGVIQIKSKPEVITPDYLFWLAISSTNDFEIVGYYINT